ncbi:hypothetical protein ACHAW6_014656 [Cyclotella cf. meneghiniana]
MHNASVRNSHISTQSIRHRLTRCNAANMNDEHPKCMYCLECDVRPPTEFSSTKLLRFGCQCKGSMGMFHVYCKAKFARFKTFATNCPRTREFYWTHCEICKSPLGNNEAVIDLARERHLQCLYHKYDSNGTGVSAEGFWMELCMSACFFATTIVKKCKDDGSSEREESSVPFWIESCNTLSSTSQLLQNLKVSPKQVAFLWCVEMKFVDCLYYTFQMMMDRSTTLEQNEEAYNKVIRLVLAYDIRFGGLALLMLQMKKCAEDLTKIKGRYRDANGKIILTRRETRIFDLLRKKIVQEMKSANESGGPERHFLSDQLSYQVEFVNFEIYGKRDEIGSK